MSIITESKILFLLKELGYEQNCKVIIKETTINIIFESHAPSKQLAQIKANLEEMLPKNNINLITTNDLNPQPKPTKFHIDNVKKIILVSSCKGGVGKSTVTSILAHKLNSKGLKVGIIDADIFGPSIPSLMKTEGKIEISGNKFIPKISNNIKVVSMGNIIDPTKAAIWRGPMVSKTLYQIMIGTNWGDLDILLVDTPPGTGDVALSLMEKYELSGAILVTTPHLLSMNELIKSVDCFKKLNVPILGLIENMSYLKSDKGTKNYIFGKSDLLQFSKDHNLNIIGTLPITPNIEVNTKSAKEYDIKLNFVIAD